MWLEGLSILRWPPPGNVELTPVSAERPGSPETQSDQTPPEQPLDGYEGQFLPQRVSKSTHRAGPCE